MMIKGKTVGEYMRRVPADKRAALQKLRATIKAAAPRATEGISYGIPAMRLNGKVLVYFAAFANHCSFFPASGRVLDEFQEELAPFRTSKGTVQFTPDKPLPASLVRRIVKRRLAQLAARAARR